MASPRSICGSAALRRNASMSHSLRRQLLHGPSCRRALLQSWRPHVTLHRRRRGFRPTCTVTLPGLATSNVSALLLSQWRGCRVARHSVSSERAARTGARRRAGLGAAASPRQSRQSGGTQGRARPRVCYAGYVRPTSQLACIPPRISAAAHHRLRHHVHGMFASRAPMSSIGGRDDS